ncbi:type II secretion system F family protein [Pelotomaculum schinkii]|nr:type II secretion system F family protein [Pelotomaculum schinkii]
MAIFCLVFLSILLFFLGFKQLKAGEQEQIALRLHRIIGDRMKVVVEKVKAKSNAGGGHRILELTGRLFLTSKLTSKFESELTKADIPLKGEEFMGLMLILPIAGTFLVTLATRNMVAGLIAAALGVYLPQFFLRRAKTKRLNKFNAQIGDALVIMANSMRSGFSFLQAMDMVRKELPPPISKDFGAALQEMNWGAPTDEALLNMAARLNSEDLELVITAVMIQRQVGGNLAEVLDTIASTIRERVKIKGEIKTLTAQGRISGLIIGLLPVFLTVVIYLISPEYIAVLFNNKTGLLLVFVAVLSQVIGLSIISKIVNIPA